jgi:hypothetical protein
MSALKLSIGGITPEVVENTGAPGTQCSYKQPSCMGVSPLITGIEFWALNFMWAIKRNPSLPDRDCG